MRKWPTYGARNKAPSAIYLHQQGYGARNRQTVINLQGRQASQGGTLGSVRVRETNAGGTLYRTVITHDAESGRGRFQSEVTR